MSRLGANLIFFGLGSIVLNLLNFEFVILMWIDLWGPTVGWAIRLGLIGLGVVLMVAAKLRSPPTEVLPSGVDSSLTAGPSSGPPQGPPYGPPR
ncbi:MAG: hypothetical protein U0935_19305 [Pirellulales bacterium]